MKYTREQAIRKLFLYAKLYKDKMLDKKAVIIYREKADLKIHHIEVLFLKRNFQHLTGVDLVDKNGNVIKGQSENFFRKCIQQKLSVRDIAFKADGTTHLKLDALPILMELNRVTRIVADYNFSRPYLIVDKLVGGVNFCLGLKLDSDCDNYVPVSALNTDIRDLATSTSQVLAIFVKDKKSDIYREIKYVAKGLNLENINLPTEIMKLISLENYTYK
jgi:hypothetical protein